MHGASTVLSTTIRMSLWPGPRARFTASLTRARVEVAHLVVGPRSEARHDHPRRMACRMSMSPSNLCASAGHKFGVGEHSTAELYTCYARMSKSCSRRPCSRCGPAGGRTQRGRGPPPGRRSSSCSRRGTCAWGVGWHRSSRRHSHRPHSRTPALATPRASRAHARPGPDQARTL